MEPRHSPLAWPLTVWLLVQLAALAVGAGGVPLSANAPRPAETLAVHVMLVTQTAAAAVLWPVLFGAWRPSLAVIATAAPFVQAAGFLSATPVPRLLAAGGILLLWLAALAVLPIAPRASLRRPVFHALLVLVSIGGATASYLAAEFSPAPPPPWTGGPTVWVLGEISGMSGTFPWILAGSVFIVCLLARFIGKARAS